MLDGSLDRPPRQGPADVTLVLRGITVPALVEVSGASLVVVRPSVETLGDRAAVGAGDPVELYWTGGGEERALRGTVQDVEDQQGPRWHLAVTGPAELSQRRTVVRARIAMPVEIPWAGGLLLGTTVDVSEGGMRALVDGWGIPMDPGTRSWVTLTLEDGLLDLHGEVVWTVERGTAQWLLAVRFLGLHPRTADRLRRRVFQALREERAATAR